MYDYDKNEFGNYLIQLRKAKNVSMAKLCDGLCDIGMLSRFERGERLPDKLLQERFLTRLGVALENHEEFLGIADYNRWLKRQNIVENIMQERYPEVGLLLKEYKEEYPMEQPLEEQFYLAMLGQVRRNLGAGEEELRRIFSRAASLTVQNVEGSWRDKVLSMEEINLVMEALLYSENAASPKRWRELFSYIEAMQKTPLSMAKLYPKAVYYCYRSWIEQSRTDKKEAEKLLCLCNQAIEFLREANRLYYMWELFEAKEYLLSMLYGEQENKKEENDSIYRECAEWKKTLKEIYEKYDVSKKMRDFCYLYIGAETYCIGDIIRTRRKMLGLTMKQLCEGICSERTISRLESKKMEAQREITVQLLLRLNLSPELIRKEIVTSGHELILRYDRLKDEMNNHRIENAEQLVGELQEQLGLQIPLNRQELKRNLLGIKYYKKEIDKTEYVRQLKRILEHTISYEAAVSEGEKYLTHVEMYCLRNAVRAMEGAEREKCNRALKELCEDAEQGYRLRLFDFIWGWIAGEIGNQGDYDMSDEMELKRLKVALRHRKISSVHSALYGMLWNDAKRCEDREVAHRLLSEQKGLKQCISLSSLCKDTLYSPMYQKKLENGILC